MEIDDDDRKKGFFCLSHSSSKSNIYLLSLWAPPDQRERADNLHQSPSLASGCPRSKVDESVDKQRSRGEKNRVNSRLMVLVLACLPLGLAVPGAALCSQHHRRIP